MNVNNFAKDGKFLMLALDHRESFKKLINPENPDAVTDEQAIELKKRIIDSVSDQFSGVLIDETYGLDAYPEHIKPFLLPIEKSGYKDQEGERLTELGYRATELITMGASGVKILVYFNPTLQTAREQLDLSKKVVEECNAAQAPLFLEIVTYTTDGKTHTQDPELVLNSLQTFLDNGIHPAVYKLEYPGNQDACQRITGKLGQTPWILLTNPDSYEEFVAHLKEAASAGAKGFLAGRALWKEACSLQGKELDEFLNKTIKDRFREISSIILNS